LRGAGNRAGDHGGIPQARASRKVSFGLAISDILIGIKPL
jgi:hypothetical protein